MFNGGYYCKDNICIFTDYEGLKPFIEIPDNYGNKNLYIVETFTPGTIVPDDALIHCSSTSLTSSLCISFKCTTDSQCLYNKCIDNHCVFNDKASVVFCDAIYVPPSFIKRRSSYMHCGKVFNNNCKSNDECSSKICTTEGLCDTRYPGPGDSGHVLEFLPYFYGGIFIIVVIIVACVIWHEHNYKKSDKKNNFDNIYNKIQNNSNNII